MKRLWTKKGISLHPAVNAYMISKDLAADNALLPYDVKASIAHAEMLARVKLISEKEALALVKTLREILRKHAAGKLKLLQEYEDCHTIIENYLTEKLGDTGGKIHLGRSRNDQVLVAVRLYTKDHLSRVARLLLTCADTVLVFARAHEWIPMPGYTHTQQAMPSSVGQWAGNFVESLLDDDLFLHAAGILNDQNPLGSAAGFGTALPIDRAFVTRKLGFSRTQINALYCQNSRGKIESAVVFALLQTMMTLGKIANDLVWFTSREFQFFTVDPSFTTGSSIMPQKRNLDVMEVLRANVSVVSSCLLELHNAGHNLISGYHKDLKITKKPVMEAFDITESSLFIVELLFHHLAPNFGGLRRSFTHEIFATDKANRLAVNGLPFREAYRKVAEGLKNLDSEDLEKNIRSKKHIGATGNLLLAHFKKEIRKRRARQA